ncbi:mitochondrial ATP-independent inner membrane protease subunit 1b-like [Euphorbia lathyris]|uniref:mitochondrial ATP-independent inner membrane protease subunit 1b-like n=1 Tax=Euphorbia lathyris TaxID=212925 RepID=UPI0033143E26
MNHFFIKSLAVDRYLINRKLFTLAYCYGPCMVPTINLSGEYFLAEKISHRIGKVRTGDIVLIRSPTEKITKRVKGMEGDSVTYVIDPNNSDETNTVVIPKGHVWVEGDNIYNSKDSRVFGPVPYGLLCGRIFWRLWPPHRVGPMGRKEK